MTLLTPVEDHAIAARMALVVGRVTFDRLFAGVRFDEVDGGGDILFVYAKDEETAAEMEDNFALSHIDRCDGHSEAQSRHRARLVTKVHLLRFALRPRSQQRPKRMPGIWPGSGFLEMKMELSTSRRPARRTAY
jgi:hypothetical protein